MPARELLACFAWCSTGGRKARYRRVASVGRGSFRVRQYDGAGGEGAGGEGAGGEGCAAGVEGFVTAVEGFAAAVDGFAAAVDGAGGFAAVAAVVIALPAGVTSHHLAPNPVDPWPVVMPAPVSFSK